MTAVSISQAPQAPPPQSLTTKTGGRTDSSHESAFGSQLQEAIEEQNGQSKNAAQGGKPSDGDAPQAGQKKDSQSQLPVLAIVLAAILPMPLPGAFGLPAAGTEPGQNSDNTAAPGEAQAVLPIDTAVPAAAAPAPTPAQPELKADLAFALKLDTTAVVAPAARDSATPAPAAIGLPAAIVQPSGTSFGLSTADKSAAPPPDAKPHLSAQSIKAEAAASQPAATRQSDTSGSDAGSSEKDSSKDQWSSSSSREQPAVEAKTAHAAGPMPAAANSARPEIPGPTPNVIGATAAQLVEPHTQAPANTESQAPITDHATAAPDIRTTPASSEVTDVSVTLAIPRADSAGDDRVAIRMVQRGTEIHVSVRTPDHQLTESLRQDLGKLSTGLDQAGFHTESWRPTAVNVAAQAQSNARHESNQTAANHDGPGSDARSGGHNGRGARDQRRQQQDEAPRWVAELEHYKNQ